MLSVGVEGHDDVGAFVQSKFDSGLQRRALSEIDRMADHDGARALQRRSAVASVEPSSTNTIGNPRRRTSAMTRAITPASL